MQLEETARAANGIARKELLVTLDQKLDPKHTALLIIDVQNDFCASGG